MSRYNDIPPDFDPRAESPPAPLRRRRRKVILRSIVVLLALSVTGYILWIRRSPRPPTPIFQGVRYECVDLTDPDGGGGLAHIVEIDLKAPGIEFYVSPLEEKALIKGWEYTTVWPWRVAGERDLAVVVNGTTFQDEDGLFPWPGDLARSSETIVSNTQINHIDPHSYLLWFDRDLNPHLETTKPPSRQALEQAVWGVAGQEVVMYDGVVGTRAEVVDARTIIAFNPNTKTLWIAVFENASYRFAAQTLALRGATHATMLDGGTSSTMTLGWDARNVRFGTLLNGWRPVGNIVGIRAKPLGKSE